jgi:hypothetical protein
MRSTDVAPHVLREEELSAQLDSQYELLMYEHLPVPFSYYLSRMDWCAIWLNGPMLFDR